MTSKPREPWGLIKFFRERFAAGRSDVNRPACVMFAVTRSRADAENFFHGFPCCELPFDDLSLIGNAPECRNNLQCDAIVCGCGFKFVPGRGRSRGKLLFAPINILAD